MTIIIIMTVNPLLLAHALLHFLESLISRIHRLIRRRENYSHLTVSGAHIDFINKSDTVNT